MTFVKSCRAVLVLIRLLLLYVIFCYWLVVGGLALRDWHATGQALNHPAITGHSQITAPPFLGVTVQLAEQSPAQQQAALQRLHTAGFGWVRQRIDWGQIEASPQVYDWTTTDRLLDAIVQNRLAPVVVLDGSPAWARRPIDQASTENAFAPPADPQTFARFAVAFASRYGDRVRFYQIWDEPNIAPHWGKRWIEPVEYAQLLIAASRVIRAADPTAIILSAALAPTADRGHLAIDEVYFLQRMLAAGAAPWFDAVAIQPFGFGYAPGDSRQSITRLNFQRAALIRRAMIDAGIGDKALWAVRFGWNTRPNSPWATVSTENQRRYTVEAIQLARHNWPWLTAMGWAIDRPNTTQDDPLWGFALDEGLREGMGRWGDREMGKWGQIPRSPDRPIALFLTFPLILWRAIAAIALLRTYSANSGKVPHSAFRIPHLIPWLVLLFVYYLATWPPLIGLCWLVAAGLIALDPQVGLCLAAATIPFYFQHKELAIVDQVLIIPPSLAATICLLPSIMRGAWRVVRKSLRPPHSAFDLLALFWLLLNLLSAVNVWHWSAYRSGLIELVVHPLLLYAAIRLFVRTEAEQWRLVMAFLAGGGIVAGWGLVDWLSGGGVVADGVRRLAGLYFSPNHTALILLRTLLLAIGVAIVDRKHPLGWLALLGIIFAALLLTASRGALLLGLPVGLFVIGWWVGGERLQHAFTQWRWVAIVLGLLVIGGLFLAQDRLLNSVTLFNRLAIWRTAFALWQHFPLLGTGAGGFFWNYPAFLSPTTNVEANLLHPHNLWLEFATTWGMIGLVWLGVLLVVLWKTLYRESWLQCALLCALVAALVHAQVDAFMTLPDLAAWNWVALGLYATVASRLRVPASAASTPSRPR